MPKALDRQRLTITHDPTQRLDTNIGRLPDIDIQAIASEALINTVELLTGLDMSSPEAFVTSLITLVTTGNPGQNWAQALIALLAPIFTPGGGSTQLETLLSQLLAALQPANNTNNNWLSAVGEAWENTLAQIATLQAQVAAINNHPSTPASQTGIDVAGWTNVSGTMAFSANGSYLQTAALAAAYRALEPATDKQFASIEIDAKQQGVTRCVICADTAFTNYAAVEVCCGFDGDSVRIVTGSSPSLTVIQKEAEFLVPKLSNKWVFEIRYDSTANAFTVRRNGTLVPELVWTDSTNIVTHGSTKRKVGAVTNALSGTTGQQGPAVSKFTFGDWV